MPSLNFCSTILELYVYCHLAHIVIEQYLVEGAKDNKQIADEVDEVVEGEEGLPFPPAQWNFQLCVIKGPHCL